MKYFALFYMLLLTAQPMNYAVSQEARSETELIRDAKKERESALDKSPENAIESASRNGQIEAIIAGVANREFNIRSFALRKLINFPASQQKAALARILRDDEIWHPEVGGERAACQISLEYEMAAALRAFNVTAVVDLNSVWDHATREFIATQLIADAP